MRLTAMINYTRAFDSAWERMMVILFRPFDLGKWFVIGFSAFLAGLVAGGNGFNTSFNTNFNQHKSTGSSAFVGPNMRDLQSTVTHLMDYFQSGLAIFLVVLAALFVFGVILVLYWLGLAWPVHLPG